MRVCGFLGANFIFFLNLFVENKKYKKSLRKVKNAPANVKGDIYGLL